MDLNKYLKSGGDTPKEEEGRLSKEEYAAQKCVSHSFLTFVNA